MFFKCTVCKLFNTHTNLLGLGSELEVLAAVDGVLAESSTLLALHLEDDLLGDLNLFGANQNTTKRTESVGSFVRFNERMNVKSGIKQEIRRR